MAQASEPKPTAADIAQEQSVRLFEATCSIEGIWLVPMPRPSEPLLGAFEYGDNLPPPLAKFADGWSDYERAELFSGDDGAQAWEALFENMYAAEEAGFVVLASVPVFTNCGSGANYSWGHYRSRPYFAATVDEAIALACADAEADYAAATTQVPA